MRKYQSRNFKKEYNLGQYAPLYRNSIFSLLKSSREGGQMEPFGLDFGPVSFYIARHFGFCKGVENAIEVAYETLAQNPDRRVFMISELIHNSFVNDDLKARGLKFLKTAKGVQLIPWTELRKEDIVITPAFGATREDKEMMETLGVDLAPWNATCRFVENVWFRARELGEQGYTIIVHGKFRHEETLATLSHSQVHAPTVVVKDMEEAAILADIMTGAKGVEEFNSVFGEKASTGFSPQEHLQKVAVVNQTTMLATETAAISDFFRTVMVNLHGEDRADEYIANTRDTLCYATKNNQNATLQLLEQEADLAIVIGGRNSSNTSHLVELCEEKLKTYFIASERDILSHKEILHYDFHTQTERIVEDFLPQNQPAKILITSGASCPDAIVERVLLKLTRYFDQTRDLDLVLTPWKTPEETHIKASAKL